MTEDEFRISLTDRQQLLADAGFIRDDLRIWTHPDGRAIGEGVVYALTDEAFFRYLKIELPEISVDESVRADAGC